jgi:hypothetical protein
MVCIEPISPALFIHRRGGGLKRCPLRHSSNRSLVLAVPTDDIPQIDRGLLCITGKRKISLFLELLTIKACRQVTPQSIIYPVAHITREKSRFSLILCRPRKTSYAPRIDQIAEPTSSRHSSDGLGSQIPLHPQSKQILPEISFCTVILSLFPAAANIPPSAFATSPELPTTPKTSKGTRLQE